MGFLMRETLRITGLSMGTIFMVMAVLYLVIKVMRQEDNR